MVVWFCYVVESCGYSPYQRAGMNDRDVLILQSGTSQEAGAHVDNFGGPLQEIDQHKPSASATASRLRAYHPEAHASSSISASPFSQLLSCLYSSPISPLIPPYPSSPPLLSDAHLQRWLPVLRTLASRPLRFTSPARYVLFPIRRPEADHRSSISQDAPFARSISP